MLKPIFVFLFLLSLLAPPAHAGREEGGGDPDAVEYVRVMKEVASLIRRQPVLSKIVNADQFAELTSRIESSLNDDDVSNDLVEFTDQPIVIEGVMKPAIYTGRKARVYRKAWLEYGRFKETGKKRAITLLEGLLALGIRVDRYKTADKLIFIDQGSVAKYSLLGIGHGARVVEKSCEINTKVLDRTSNRILERASDANGFGISWETADRSYSIDRIFEVKDQMKNKSLLLVKTLLSSEPIGEGLESILIHTQGEAFRVYSETDITRQSLDEHHVLRFGDDGHEERWNWSNGQIRNLARLSKATYEEDGSITTIDEDLEKLAYAGMETISYVKTCQLKPNSENWIEKLGYATLVKTVKSFDQQIGKVNRLDLAMSLCLSQKSEDCSVLNKSLESAKLELTKFWNRIAPVKP